MDAAPASRSLSCAAGRRPRAGARPPPRPGLSGARRRRVQAALRRLSACLLRRLRQPVCGRRVTGAWLPWGQGAGLQRCGKKKTRKPRLTFRSAPRFTDEGTEAPGADSDWVRLLSRGGAGWQRGPSGTRPCASRPQPRPPCQAPREQHFGERTASGREARAPLPRTPRLPPPPKR